MFGFSFGFSLLLCYVNRSSNSFKSFSNSLSSSSSSATEGFAKTFEMQVFTEVRALLDGGRGNIPIGFLLVALLVPSLLLFGSVGLRVFGV